MTTIDIAGRTLLHFVWEGTLLGGAAALALHLLRHRTANARYIVGCVALASMVVAPAMTAFVVSGPAMVDQLAGRLPAHVSVMAAPSESSAADTSHSTATQNSHAVRDAAVRSWPAILVGAWLIGVAVLLLRVGAGWWSLRRLRLALRQSATSSWRSVADVVASRLHIRRACEVIDSIHVDTPAVIGILKPVIVLPVAALANLTPVQVEAILAHELAHVRRHDALVNVLQVLAETLLFYHPAVWWVSSRIRTEREHCCDDVAASVCGDAVVYAEALLELEQCRGSRPSLALAATGGPLLQRIRRLLAPPPHDTSRSATAVTVATLATILICIIAAVHHVRASQADPRPLTPIDPGDAAAWQMVFNNDDSQMRFIGFRGRDLVRFAYQVPAARVVGGPRWIDEEILRLVVNLGQAPRADEMPDLVRRVLEEQLHLQTHVDRRLFPVLALVTARADGTLGPGLRPSTVDCFDVEAWVAAGQPPRPLPPAIPRQPVCGEPRGRSYVAITMPEFAEVLRHRVAWPAPSLSGLPVVDETGLNGRFDVDFDAFTPATAVMGRIRASIALLEPLGFHSLPHALEEQLGLTLEPSEAPFDVVVIDSAERPQP